MPGWVLKAPEASLFDAAGVVVGSHAAGPTWTSAADGSTVVGKKMAQADAPDAQAIPWLLLGAGSRSGRGIFSATTFIQRVNTVGGRAPATGCGADSLGTERRVEYSADYVFYQGGVPPSVPGG